MRSPVIALALTFAVGCGGYVFAADDTPQPLTRADCDAASMKWNDDTNVCGAAEAAAAPEAAAPEAAAPAAEGPVAESQPLTRADCDAAGMEWNDGANVCGSGAVAQPLTRADCDAAGMKWNDDRNVCGAFVARHKREVTKEVKQGGKKIVKTVKTKHGVKKTVVHKDHHKKEAAPKKGGFLQWLKKNKS